MTNPFIEDKETSNPYLQTSVEFEDTNSYVHNLETRINASFLPGEDLETFSALKDYSTDNQRQQVIEAARKDYFNLTAEFAPIIAAQNGPETAAEIVSTAEETAPSDYDEALIHFDNPSNAWNINALQEAKLAKLWDDSTWGEVLRDMFIPTASIEAMQMTGEGYFAVEQGLEKLHYAYVGLPYEEKIRQMDTIVGQALAYSEGNKTTARQLVEAIFYGPGTEFWWDRVGLATLPLDVVGGAKSALTLTNKAIKGTNHIMRARSLAQRAAVIEDAITNPEVAKAAGTATDNVALGVYDQIKMFDTGMTPETAFELDHFYKATAAHSQALEESLGLIQPKTIEREFMELDLDGIGSKIKRAFLPPDNALGAINEVRLVEPRFIAESQVAYVRENFAQPLFKSMKSDIKASGMEKQWVQTINKLDELQQEPTFDELVAMFRERGGTTKQAELAATAALKRRALTKAEHIELNKILVNERKAEGFSKHIELDPNNHINIKPFDDPTALRQSMGQNNVNVIWDVSEGRQVSKSEIDRLLQEGKVIGRTNLRDTVNLPGTDSVYDYVAVTADKVQDLKQVLKYRAGYVPKFNKDVRYLVKRPVKAKRNGRSLDNAYYQVDQAFSTSQKARNYAESLIAQGVKQEDIIVQPAREFSTEDSIRAFDMFGGTMYTGGRKTTPLHVDGKIPVRAKDPIEATNMALNYLQRKKLLGSVTQLAEEQWFNTAKKVDPNMENYVGSFEGAMDHVRGLDPALRDKLSSLHSYIKERKASNSGRASDIQSGLIKLAESLTNDTVLSRAMWKAADINIVNKHKSLAYHAFMGFGSISQLPVQASTTMLAFAKHPAAFTKALPHIIGTFWLEFLPPVGKILTKKLGGNFKSAYDDWVRSGTRPSIRNNPDLARLSTLGSSKEKLEYLSTFFVEQGEALSRMAAFFTARELKSGAPLREVMTEARRIGMDMTSANKNWWQDGVPGVLSQFNQILAKTYGEMMPKVVGGKASVTGAERARMWVASLTGLGIAGVPFGSIIDEIVYKFMPDDADPTLVEAYKRGLTGVIMNALDWDNEIQTRVSLAAGLPMLIEKLFTDNEVDAIELMGPVGTVYKRIGQAFRESREGIASGNWMGVVRGISGVPSSTRHLWAAWVHSQTNQLYSLENRAFVNINLNNAERVLLSMGFQPTELKDTYTWEERNRARKNALSYTVNTAMKAHDLGELSTEEVMALSSMFALDRDLYQDFKDELRKRSIQKYKNPIRDKLIDGLLNESKTYGVPTAARILEGE